MTKKEQFIQLVQTLLMVMANFRPQEKKLVIINTLSTMNAAQRVKEECIPDNLYQATYDFMSYVDSQFCELKDAPPKPSWLKFDDEA